VADAPPARQDQLARLYAAARRDSTNGVVAQTQKVRLRYWTHWSHFCRTVHNNVDPFLDGVSKAKRVALLEAFARYIREGNAGRGHTVRAGSVQDALCAVGKIFELDLRPNPIYQEGTYRHYWEPLNSILRKYRRDDPRSHPQLAVPVTLPQHLLQQTRSATQPPCPFSQAKADLVNIAFYYLLHVGEYTHPRSTSTNAKPFKVCDVTFRTANGTLIPNHSPQATLLTAAEATIRMPNQKNGTKGQCIHQQCTNTIDSPVKSLAHRVAHILAHGGPVTTPIYKFKHPLYQTWREVTAPHINSTIKEAAKAVGLYNLGYMPSDVSSHSLRAGGAMAMHLNGVDALTIRKMGRWKSDTFLMYIHEQISAFATGVSYKMSHAIPFHQIAGPTISEHPLPILAH